MKHEAIIPQPIDSQSPHAMGKSPDVLGCILKPGVNLSLWQRATKCKIAQELSSLQASSLPDMRCRTALDSFGDDVDRLLRQQDLDLKDFGHWRDDLDRLAEFYFSISGNRDVTMRLETTDDDGCHRFHSDRTHLRLLCTYRGPGTQWLTNDQVNRSAHSNGATNDAIIRFGKPCELAPFWVGIMKGDGYPGNKGQGLVHRSPPIAITGQIRVLFCLDC